MTEKENLIRAIKREDPQWVPCGMESEIFLVHPIIERPRTAGRDDWGVRWELAEDDPGSGTAPVAGDYVISDIDRWREQLKVPDVDSYDWTQIVQDWERKPIDLSKIDRDMHWITGALDMGIFERLSLLMGMEGLLVNVALEPETVKEIADVLADYNVRVIKKFNSVFPLDMVRYGDDWGSQRQMMISPDSWRHIFGPATQKIYDAIHGIGAVVFQHSCGFIENIIPDLIEMGMDVWDPCQPCNDLKSLKEKYGDSMTFCGGIDSQFVLEKEGVTAGEVRSEVRRRMDELAEGGGFIARPSHFIDYEEYVMDAMTDEIRKSGRYAAHSI